MSKIDLIVSKTEADLNKQIDEKRVEGWEPRGEVIIAQPSYGDTNAPKFIYYSQFIVK